MSTHEYIVTILQDGTDDDLSSSSYPVVIISAEGAQGIPGPPASTDEVEAALADEVARAIAAEGVLTDDLAAHEADTTGVHGIPDTSLLETQSGAQTKATAAQTAAAADATSKVLAETTRASNAESGLSDALDNEIARATGVEAVKADLVGGLVPTSQIPAQAFGTAVPVADQAAMLALTSLQVQPGDLAVRGDGAGTFMLMDADPSILGNWQLLNTPTSAVTSVNGQVGTVVLGYADVGADAAGAAATAQANASADATTKADAAAAASVPLAGPATKTGTLTFSDAPAVPDDSFTIAKTDGLQDALDVKATDSLVMHLANDETATGIKTFTNGLVAGDVSTLHAAGALVQAAGTAGTETSLVTSAASARSGFSFIRSTGTVAAPTTVASGDLVGFLGFKGYDGTSTAMTGLVQGYVDGVVSTGVVPMGIDFITGTTVANRAARLTIKSDGTIKPADGSNYELGTTTGTKFGTATSQKLAFYNSTPVVQSGATTDLGTVLSNLGLRAAGTAYPISTSGTVAFTDNFPTLTSTTGTSTGWAVTVYGDTAGGQNVFNRARGTVGVPTAVQNGDVLGAFSFRGNNGSGFTGSKALINGTAAETWTGTANGTYLTFYTTPLGSTTLTERLRVADDGRLTTRGSAYVNSATTTIDASLFSVAGTLNANVGAQSQLVQVQASVNLQQAQTAFYGMIFLPTHVTSAQNVTTQYGIFSRTDLAASYSGTVTSLHNFYSGQPVVSGGAITSFAGMTVAANSAATNNTLLLLGTSTIPTGNFAIYSPSSAASTFTGTVGLSTTAPTHSLTLGSTATGIAQYNTADQTTNYERGRAFWSSNIFTLSAEVGGTGTLRNLRLSANGSQLDIGVVGGTSGFIFTRGSTSLTTIVEVASTLISSSSAQASVLIGPTINQTSTAAYTALKVNVTETATGSGLKLLADFQVGAASKAVITNAGFVGVLTNAPTHSVTLGSTATGVAAYNTSDQTTNYERVREFWGSNIFSVFAENGGSGSLRSIRVGNSANYIDVGGNAAPWFQFTKISQSAANVFIGTSGFTSSLSSGNAAFLSLTPAVNQSGTAGYTGILVNITETATGSGAKFLAQFQVGSSNRAYIDSTGVLVAQGGVFSNNAGGAAIAGITSGGVLEFGTGTGARDTNLYRNAANSLATDDSLTIMGSGSNRLTVQTGAATGGISLGADVNNFTRTSDVRKLGVITGRNYANIADIELLSVDSTDASTNNVNFGGRVGASTTAATTINFLTAADTTTTGGTVRLSINNAGTVAVTGKVTTTGGITPRVNTLTVGGSTYTPNCDTTDVAIISSPGAAFTVANPSGTAQDGQELTLRVKSGGTGYAPTWGANYLASGMTVLPTAALPVSKTVTFKFQYDSVATKWILLAYDSVGY